MVKTYKKSLKKHIKKLARSCDWDSINYKRKLKVTEYENLVDTLEDQIEENVKKENERLLEQMEHMVKHLSPGVFVKEFDFSYINMSNAMFKNYGPHMPINPHPVSVEPPDTI